MKRYFILMFAVCLILGVAVAQLDIGSEKPQGGGLVAVQSEVPILIQTQIDSNFPCKIIGESTIVCEALSIADQQEFSDSLNFFDKATLGLFGVPVRNLQGNAVQTRSIQSDERTVIEVDLSAGTAFKIGFASNLFVIDDLTRGVFNQTQELGGDVELTSGNLDGSYFTQIVDLNNTKSVTNISFESSQPAGTEITLYTRTFNMTNGSGLSNNIKGYWRFDSSDNVDYSGNNQTFNTSKADTETYSVDGKFDNAIDFSRDSIKVNMTQQLKVTEDFSVSLWVKTTGLQTETQAVFIDASSWGDQTGWNILDNGPHANRIVFRVHGSGGHCDINGGVREQINDGAWHSIIVTRNGITNKIYIDGVQTGTDACTNFDMSTIPTFTIGSEFDGMIDELVIWNDTLSAGEITDLAAGKQVTSWSDWTIGVTATGTTTGITVDNGRYVQVKADLERDDTGKNVELNNITLGFKAAGVAVFVDNPPQVSLVTPDLVSWTGNNASLNTTQTDDWAIVNVSIWHNVSGSFTINETLSSGGKFNSSNFTIRNIADGKYLWSACVTDNSTVGGLNGTQITCATNRTFEITVAECNPVTCGLFACNNATEVKACYTECNSHDHVRNGTLYCNSINGASVTQANTTAILPSDCTNKELSGLSDNAICDAESTDSRTFGWCYPDIIGSTEFCTGKIDNCVEGGIEYGQGDKLCLSGGNDFRSCLGGESTWDDVVDCTDFGDPTDASATVPEHTYCGFFSAATCSSAGCSTPSTNDCGDYFYNNTASLCGNEADPADLPSSCDVGCGATYDTSAGSCPSPNTLSADCSICTPPAIDNPPAVGLVSPLNDSIVSTLQVEFQYTISDINMTNASLYVKVNTGAWNLNLTNFTAIIFDGATINKFFQNFTNGANVTWNVFAIDNGIPQFSFAPENSTLFIDTQGPPPAIAFEIYNETETSGGLLFSVSDEGNTIIKNDLDIGNDLINVSQILGEPTNIPQLNVSTFLDIAANTLLGVRLNIPFTEHLRFSGKNGMGDLLFELSSPNVRIFSQTATLIRIGNALNVEGNIEADSMNTTGDINIGGNLTVVGDTTFGEDVDITGNVSIGNNLTVGGNFTAEGEGKFGGDLSVGGDLDLTGDIEVVNLVASNNISVANEVAIGEINTDGVLRVFDINPLGDLQIAGGFNLGDGGVTIDSAGNIWTNGNITLQGGEFNVTAGDSIFGGNLVPDTDNIYDVGTTEFRWRNLNVGTDAIINGTLDVSEGLLYVNKGTRFVGIGTATPSELLSVVGGNLLLNSTVLQEDGLTTWWGDTGNKRIAVRHLDGKTTTTAGYDTLYLQYYAAGKGVVIGDTGTDHPLTVYGDVGIGTVPTIGKLHVEENDLANVAAFFGDDTAGQTDSVYIMGNTINGLYEHDSDTSSLWLNYGGYQGGTTRFRDLSIGDGKQNEIMFIDGSDASVQMDGALTVDKIGTGQHASPEAEVHAYGGDSGWAGARNFRIANGMLLETAADSIFLMQSPNDETTAIWFGDEDSEIIGRITYLHATDTLQLQAGNVIPLQIKAATGAIEGVIINEDSRADVDFRVEGNTDANLLFTDASADKVGIGTASPTYLLDVEGDMGFGTLGGTGNTNTIYNNADATTKIRMTHNTVVVNTDSMLFDVAGSTFISLNDAAGTESVTVTPNSIFSGTLKANDYYSGDGTQGMTGSCGAVTTHTVKDGLITACA